ncbi:MAG: GNAT family N-acetyltransferase [Gammaproteobacteria bacterium]
MKDWNLHSARDALSDPGGALAAEWAELNSDLFDEHPLLSPAFVVPLVRHFAGPDVLLARWPESGPRRALLLLRPRAAGLWSTFLPSQSPISPALLGPDADITRLLRDLPGAALGVDFLCQDPLYSGVTGRFQNENREQVRHLTTTAAELTSTFEDYWAARPKNLRRNMKRYFNRLEASGDQPRLEVHAGLLDAHGGLHRYGILESAGWKGAAGTAIHPDNAQGRFYADLLGAFGERRCFRVYELYIGDRLAASRLCVLNRSMLIVLKTTYDEALSQFAPGRVLLYLLLEREFRARELSRVEFYTNANADSISWSTTTRDIYHVTHYRMALMRQVIEGSRPWRQSLRDKFARRRPLPESPADGTEND